MEGYEGRLTAEIAESAEIFNENSNENSAFSALSSVNQPPRFRKAEIAESAEIFNGNSNENSAFLRSRR